MDANVPDLATYHVSPVYGFLLDSPLTSLPEYFSPWEEIAKDLEVLLQEKSLRKKVDELALLDHIKLRGHRQLRLAFTYLSFISNGYIWQDGDKGVSKVLPRQLAIPLCAIAQYLGTKPILNHNSFCLSNWKKIDPNGPLHYRNLDTIVRFPGGDDFRFFTVVTTQVELEALPGIKACVDVLQAVTRKDKTSAIEALLAIKNSLKNMKDGLASMHKEVSPDVFFNVVRPLLSGWGGPSSVLPEGLIYEGVSNEPQEMIGGSAAQSTTLTTFDATLGVSHSREHQDFLDKVLYYMPTLHREFIFALRRGPSLCDFVETCKDPELTAAYNDAVTAEANFRTSHIALVTRYIVLPSKQKDRNQDYENVATKGTGGTDLLPFLKNLRDKTNAKLMA